MNNKPEQLKYIIIIVCIIEIIISLVVLIKPSGHYKNAEDCDSIFLISILHNGHFCNAFVDEEMNLVTPFDYYSTRRNNDCYIAVNRKRYDLYSKYAQLLNIDPDKRKVPYSFIDKSGRVINSHTYTSNRIVICGFSKGLSLLRVDDNGKQGLVDSNGETIIEPEFDLITNFSYGYASIKKNGKWGFINTQGIIVEPQYDSICFNMNIAKIEKNGKWGWAMLDTTLSIIEPNYYQIEYNTGVFKVKESKGEGYCIINPEGERLTDGEYDAISLYDGYAITMKNNLWGYFFYDTREEIPPKFSVAGSFFNGIALVKMKSDNNQTQCTFINTKCEMIRNQWFKNAHSFQNGLAAVETDKGWGYIDENGEMAIQPRFAEANSFVSKTVAIVKDYGTKKQHVINRKGNYVFQDGYETIKTRYDGTFAVKDDLWGRVDSTGRVIIPLICQNSGDIQGFGNKYFRVKIPEGYVLYDRKGNKITKQTAFDEIGSCSLDGFFSIRNGNCWGFIDSIGMNIIEPKYDEVRVFNKGFASVRKGNVWGLIDSKGTNIIEPKYDLVGFFNNGFAPIKKDGLWGIVDIQGKEVIKPRYLNQVNVDNQGRFITNIAGVECIIDSTNTIKIKSSN